MNDAAVPGILAELFADADRFLLEHWDRQPFHGRSQVDVANLITLDAVDELITSSVLFWPIQIRLAKNGSVLEPSAFTSPVRSAGLEDAPLTADPAAVVEQFLDGASILLQGMQRICPPIGELCSRLDAALTHSCTASVFLTPPRAQGLPRHHDPYDVIVLQVEGRKRWELREPTVARPLDGGTDQRTDPGPPHLEVELAPGDVLYLPQGWIHSARALEATSLHVSVMVDRRRWLDLVSNLLADLAADADLRRALPVGYAHDPGTLVDGLRDAIARVRDRLGCHDVEGVAKQAAYQFWSTRRPSRRHQLAQAIAVDRIDEHTCLRARGGADMQVLTASTTVTILLGQRKMTLPIDFEPAIRRLTGPDLVRVNELAPALRDELRLPFVRQLVREGYVEVVDGPGDLLP